jgi:hypothetical protein
MAINTSMMLETIEEGLNEVFYDSFQPETLPDYAKIEDIFKTGSSKKHSEYDLENKGVGRYKTKDEEEDINEDNIKEKYKTTFTHVAYSNSVPISFEYMEDDLYNIVKDDVGDLGMAGRDTDYNNAFSIFRNAFSASYLGADGKALCATDHPRDFGTNLGNLVTGKLSASVLQDMIKRLSEQRTHAGTFSPNMPDTLLVTPYLYPLAVQLTEAKLIPGSANNDPNVFSAKYGIKVKQSPYLGTVAGGSDHYFFLLGKRHKIKKFTRKDIMTWMTPWQQSRKMHTYYNAYFRNSYGWSSPIGIIGSNGTTGSYPS